MPTSVQWIFAAYFPAEYVRLMLALLTQQAQATLADGSNASVPADSYQQDANDKDPSVAKYLRRSWSERLFQASMMAYARPGMTYSNVNDVFDDKQQGLADNELVHMISGLCNRPYTSLSGPGSILLNDIDQRFLTGSLPILTTLRWGSLPNQGFHEVVAVAIDASNVTFRNPWGRVNYRVGQKQQDPPRKCANPMRGEETMTKSDMANWIHSIVVEKP